MKMLVEILLFGSMAANLVVFVIIQRRIFKKSFQCLYYIQSLDSCFTCIASFDLLSASLIRRYFIDTSNTILCSVMFFGNAIVPVTFPIYNFSTAYIRYENINRSLTGQRWRKNAEFKKYIHFTTSGCIIYTLGMVLANWLFEAEMSLLYSVCMNTGQAPQRPYLLGIFLGLPMMFILLLTILIDWKCHQSAKKFRRQNLQKQCLPDGGIIRTDKNMDFLKFLGQEAPMRSTIINVVTIVFCVLITSLLLFMQDQMDMILTSLALFYGLKSPFSYIWSTRVSKSNLWKLRNIERRQKLMWEREQARNQTFLIARRAHQRFLDAKLQRTRELEETRRQFNNACARFQKQCPIQFQESLDFASKPTQNPSCSKSIVQDDSKGTLRSSYLKDM